MQRSFSLVDEEDIEGREDKKVDDNPKNLTYRVQLSDDESVSAAYSPKRRQRPEVVPRQKIMTNTSRNLVNSDSEDSDIESKHKLPGEYDFKQYENLDVDEEIKEVFEYITKYIPQQMVLDYKFKPFIPEYLPAVGDIDAFLKVIPPEFTLSGEKFNENNLKLGLTVLDEPASNQSDPALLHLQLRAASGHLNDSKNKSIIVKKVEDVEKNSKVIDKWIKDISDLHKSKSSPIVRYPEEMPDLDDLLQEWPEEIETRLKKEGFPKPDPDQSLTEYIDIVCNVLQIPLTKNRIYSLHLLFSLYAAMKQTQLYQQAAREKKSKAQENKSESLETNQLVLD